MASCIPSSDLERSIAFYTNGLGMTLGGRVEMGTVVEAPLMFPGGGTYLMLQHPKAAGTALPPRGALNRVVLAVPDVKALVARLAAAGYQIKGKVNENSQYRVTIAQLEDPDGNHIELVQRLP
jgi:catechol 2,3-dioxygenase-like lactoylglutathione lyase family enzyme